jgi:hypothetical protein
MPKQACCCGFRPEPGTGATGPTHTVKSVNW